jgi:hypothetical protein
VAQLYPTFKSANYTASNLDFVEMTGGNTVTLPDPGATKLVGVQSVNGTGSAPCTVSTPSGGGGSAIVGKGVPSGATSILLGAPGAFVILEADGYNWNIIGGEQDSGWITPSSFSNSWVNGSGSPGGVQYRLKCNEVTFRGYMSGGAAGATAFTLPAGYRPVQEAVQIMTKYNGGSPQTLATFIQMSGAVQPGATDSTAAYVENMHFPVD